MSKLRFFMIICMSLLLVFVCSCNKGTNEGKGAEASAREHEQGEHAGLEHEQGEHAGDNEEAGPRISKDGIHDEIRKGVRLILAFNNESSSFIGTVENVTEKTISRVRVEVHLSNGNELGPTELSTFHLGKN